MNLKKEVDKAIGLVAAEYAYAKSLLRSLEEIEREEPNITERRIRQGLKIMRWIGRAERKVDRSEKRIIKALLKNKEDLPSLLKDEEQKLLELLKVSESSLIRKASVFTGDVKQELQEIETYEELRKKYRKNPEQIQFIEEKLKSVALQTKQEINELVRWIESTEVILKKVIELYKLLQEWEKEKVLQQGRRRFLKVAGTVAASAALSQLIKPAEVFAKTFSDEEKQIVAIETACSVIERFCQSQTRKVNDSIIFAPHADYTHFNRIGKWSHRFLEGTFTGHGIELNYGDRASVFDEQRAKAKFAQQPIDQEVSITERSLVTLANLAGRNKVAGKLAVVKHFPGGPPELETTEYNTVSDPSTITEFTYLKPFRDAIQYGAKGVMVCHASFPAFETELRKKYFLKYDEPIIGDMQRWGMDREQYEVWTWNRPASLSPRIIKGFLREELGFNGIVFPDALNMTALTAPVDQFVPRFMSNEDMEKFYTAFNVILAIYAGINYFYLFISDHRPIQEYAKNSPYFRECVDECWDRFVQLFKILGKEPPLAEDTDDKIKQLARHKLQNEWADVWDRSGTLHKIFRRIYLAALYNDPSVKTDNEKYWTLHQQTDWKNLDSLFEAVIRKRYFKQENIFAGL